MVGFTAYVMQMAVGGALIALALSVYIDGIGYTVFHLIGISGFAAYAYTLLTLSGNWSVSAALAGGILVGAIAGWLCSECLRPLRGDGLTLASFGIGVGLFELLRFIPLTGGVFGIAGVPQFGVGEPIPTLIVTVVFLIVGAVVATFWRRSLGGAIVRSIRQDEWAALSIGARVEGHQRFTGAFAGALAAAGGIYSGATTGFIEPRDFQPTNLLIPLAATILACGKTPLGVLGSLFAIVFFFQAVRFIGQDPTTAGPVSEIIVAVLVAAILVIVRVRKQVMPHGQ
jgi:ABC-type branched-subunit amino acid transport system permease subunit